MSFVVGKIKRFDRTENSKVGENWEIFKQENKVKAIEKSRSIKHEETEKQECLRATLEILIAQGNKSPGIFTDDIKNIKHKLEVIDEERPPGALIRARGEHWAVGETTTKRALGIEKKQAQRNRIRGIEWKGKITTNKNEIASAFREYYEELFELKPVDLVGFKPNFIDVLPRLDDETKEWLERSISVEVKDAIDNLKPGKSPGPDGLSASFYKKVIKRAVFSSCQNLQRSL